MPFHNESLFDALSSRDVVFVLSDPDDGREHFCTTAADEGASTTHTSLPRTTPIAPLALRRKNKPCGCTHALPSAHVFIFPLQNDVPPPGAYYRRSTLERDGRVCGSVSAKGYGTGFVSAAPRFRDLRTVQQAYLPGPGSYMGQSEGAQEGGKLASFSSLKRVRC